ncbi:MAG: hypothetical protein M0042_04340 [Nitrospiraceae bacterium]|nr:hypothetical protein [Nitrospiraceae bacterium]
MKSRLRITFMIVAAIAAMAMMSSVVAAADSVQIKSKDGVGKYLADGKGMTLYYITKDKPDRSGCTGACLEKWPAYYADSVAAPAGTAAKDFGEFTRPDGKKQVTFKGWPLYYFAGDKGPGDTNGHGIKEIWYVATPQSIQPYF